MNDLSVSSKQQSVRECVKTVDETRVDQPTASSSQEAGERTHRNVRKMYKLLRRVYFLK